MEKVLQNYLSDIRCTFQNYKTLAEKAISQVDEAEIYDSTDPESNSIAVVIKHISGNLRSRFTDFLTTDGEKSDRNRDGEFEFEHVSRADLLREWNESWTVLFDTIDSLDINDLERTVLIRGESHTVVEALNRQVTHYAYHVGQIVWLAKHFRGRKWNTLSVPKGKSDQFNAFLLDKKEKGIKASRPLEGAMEFSELKEKE